MNGYNPSSTRFSKSPVFNALSYPAHLRAKIAVLHNFGQSNLAAVAYNKKRAYDQHTATPSFAAGESAWISVPAAGKLDPTWEGDWVIKSVKCPIKMEIDDTEITKLYIQIAYDIKMFHQKHHIHPTQATMRGTSVGNPYRSSMSMSHLLLQLYLKAIHMQPQLASRTGAIWILKHEVKFQRKEGLC